MGQIEARLPYWMGQIEARLPYWMGQIEARLPYWMGQIEGVQYQAALAVTGTWQKTNTDKIYEELG